MEDQVEQHQKWWHKFIRPLLVVGIVTASVLIIALIVSIIGGYLFNWDWTGLSPYTSPPHSSSGDFQRGKTLWDWMQLLFIPVVLAVAGFWFNHRERRAAELRADTEHKAAVLRAENEQKAAELRAVAEREIEQKRAEAEQELALDNQRESALQAYINEMSELLLHENLRKSEPESEVRNIAHVRTLTVLPRLDGKRKGTMLQFLHESRLLHIGNVIVVLEKADFKGTILKFANLGFANLREANFSSSNLKFAQLEHAILNNAKLERADLFYSDLFLASLMCADLKEARFDSAHLSHTNFWSAELNGASLIRANLSSANLMEADLSGANLEDANLSGADLTKAKLEGVTGITVEQIEKQAKSLKGATMPDGSIHP